MIQVNFDENRLTAIIENAVINAMALQPQQTEPQPPERKTLHSIRELSDFIGCSTVTGQKLKNSGQIPYRQIGRKVMFDTVEVLKAMEQGKKKGLNHGK